MLGLSVGARRAITSAVHSTKQRVRVLIGPGIADVLGVTRTSFCHKNEHWLAEDEALSDVCVDHKYVEWRHLSSGAVALGAVGRGRVRRFHM